MTRNALQRLQKRAAQRLAELDITARQVAKEMRRGDAWISAVLNGRQGIQLKDLDEFARALKLPPSELVREDDTELRELSPTEMRLLRVFRDWPEPVKAHWMALIDHFAATEPDRAVAVIAALLSEKPPTERGLLVRFVERLVRAGIPPEVVEPGPVSPTSGEAEHTTPGYPHYRGSRRPLRPR